jgi:hypothetical protein
VTDLDTVRALADVNDTTWPDPAVQALLDAETGAVRLAAADLLEVLAGRLTDVESDEIKLTGSRQAATLLARAKNLREQHYQQAGGDFFFDTVPAEPCTPLVDRWFAEEGLI